MRVQIITLLAAATAVSAQTSTVTPAPVVSANPLGASYVGTLPEKAGSSLRGSIAAVSGADGEGVRFSVAFSGLPAAGGPFMYHIHEKPVPADGNCTGTGAHLDPYKRGEVPICDASKPETCQTGDLSGKHGNITAQAWSQEYVFLFPTCLQNTVLTMEQICRPLPRAPQRLSRLLRQPLLRRASLQQDTHRLRKLHPPRRRRPSHQRLPRPQRFLWRAPQAQRVPSLQYHY